MEYYAGINVSLKESSVCIMNAKGKIVRQVKFASEPETLVRYFAELELPVCRIGLEARPLSHWLHAGLVAAGRDVVLLETRHVKAALSAITVKTDRKDARGIAHSAAGLVSAGSCKIGGIARYPRRTRRSQASAGEADRRRTQHLGDLTRLWTEGRRRQPRSVRSAYRGTDRRACHSGDRDRRANLASCFIACGWMPPTFAGGNRNGRLEEQMLIEARLERHASNEVPPLGRGMVWRSSCGPRTEA